MPFQDWIFSNPSLDLRGEELSELVLIVRVHLTGWSHIEQSEFAYTEGPIGAYFSETYVWST